MSRAAPSRAKLIALLIEERAKFLAAAEDIEGPNPPEAPRDRHRDQARREIEAEVLSARRPPDAR
jgi:hypothetical protein